MRKRRQLILSLTVALIAGLLLTMPAPTFTVEKYPVQINNEVQQIPSMAIEPLQPVQELNQVPVPTPQPAPRATSSGGDIETIVRQAARKYGVDENYFVKIARCESSLNPNIVNYNYYDNGHPSGLFQHISGYWPARAAKYGWTGASVFDAQAQAEVTAQMFRDGHQRLWECK